MSKKLTLNNMKDICATNKQDKIEFDFGEQKVITIKTDLSLTEISTIVDSTVERVFTVDGDYIPEYLDVATFLSIIQVASNLPIPKKNIEVDGEKVEVVDLKLCHEWMYKTNLLKQLESDKYITIFSEIYAMIHAKVEFKKQQIINKNPLADLIENINGIITKFGESFDGIDIKDAIGKLGSIGSIDEKNLVDAFIDSKEKQSEVDVE